MVIRTLGQPTEVLPNRGLQVAEDLAAHQAAGIAQSQVSASTQQALANLEALSASEASIPLPSLEPYKNGEGRYDLFRAIQGGVSKEDLQQAFGLSDDTYRNYALVSKFVRYRDGKPEVDFAGAFQAVNGGLDYGRFAREVEELTKGGSYFELGPNSAQAKKLAALPRPKTDDDLAKALADVFGVKLIKDTDGWYQLQGGVPAEDTRERVLPEGVTQDDLTRLKAQLAELQDQRSALFKQYTEAYGNEFRSAESNTEEQNRLLKQIDLLDNQMSAVRAAIGYAEGFRRNDVNRISAEDVATLIKSTDPRIAKYIDDKGRFDLVRAIQDGLDEDILKQLDYTDEDLDWGRAYAKLKGAGLVRPDGEIDFLRARELGLDDELRRIGISQSRFDYADAMQSLSEKGFVRPDGTIDLIGAAAADLDVELSKVGYDPKTLSQAHQLKPYVKGGQLDPLAAVKAGVSDEALKNIYGLTEEELKALHGRIEATDLLTRVGIIDSQGRADLSEALARGYTEKLLREAGFAQEDIDAAKEWKVTETARALRSGKLKDYVDTAGGLDLDRAVAAGIDKLADYQDWNVSQADLDAAKARLAASDNLRPYAYATDAKGRRLSEDEATIAQAKGKAVDYGYNLIQAYRAGRGEDIKALFGEEEYRATARASDALFTMQRATIVGPPNPNAEPDLVGYLQKEKYSAPARQTAADAGYKAEDIDTAVAYGQALDRLAKYKTPEEALFSGVKADIAAFKLVYPEADTSAAPMPGKDVPYLEKQVAKYKNSLFDPFMESLASAMNMAGVADPRQFKKTSDVYKVWGTLSADEKQQVADAYLTEVQMYQAAIPIIERPLTWLEEQAGKVEGSDVKLPKQMAGPSGLFYSVLPPEGKAQVDSTLGGIQSWLNKATVWVQRKEREPSEGALGGAVQVLKGVGGGFAEIILGLAGFATTQLANANALATDSANTPKVLASEIRNAGGALLFPLAIPRRISEDPLSGVGYTIAVIVGPAAVAKILSTARTYADPYGIPSRAAGIEYSTGRLPLNVELLDARIPKGATEAVIKQAALKFFQEVMNPKKAGAVVSIEYKGIRIKGRSTPIQDTVGNVGWHGTGDITPYATLKGGKSITVAPGGLYTNPYAAGRFLAGGSQGLPVVRPGFVLLLTDAKRLRFASQNPSDVSSLKPGIYAPGSTFKGRLETQLISAAGSDLTRVEPTLRSRLLGGKAGEFFTQYSGPSVSGLHDGQLVPVAVLADKGVGLEAPSPAQLYAAKLLVLRETLLDWAEAVKHPKRTVKDILEGRYGPKGVREWEISAIAEELKKKAGEHGGSTEKAFEEAAKEAYDDLVKDEALEKAYRDPLKRRRFEDIYRAYLERAMMYLADRAVLTEARLARFARERLIPSARAAVREAARRASRRELTPEPRRASRRAFEAELSRRAMERVERRTVAPRRATARVERRATQVRRELSGGRRTERGDRRKTPRASEFERRPPVGETRRTPPPPRPPRTPTPRPPRFTPRFPAKGGGTRGKPEKKETGKQPRSGKGKISWKQGELTIQGRKVPVWITIQPKPLAKQVNPEYSLRPPEDAQILKRTPEQTFYVSGKDLIPNNLKLAMGIVNVRVDATGRPHLKYGRRR